jgi:phospholipid/cholesterol/gamma-HCH transport system substrate-binding protein
MEIRARYTLIGLFTLLSIAAGFTFVYWLNRAGGLGQRAVYRAQFENTVSGLLKGSAVLFNGIRVGEVTELRLSPDNPKRVVAYLAVAQDTPVRADTKVGIEFQGLMGSPVVSLSGGSAKAQALDFVGGEPPLLTAPPDAGQNMTEQARTVLRNLDSVITDNSKPLKDVIANIDKFSAALARNTDKVDGIIAGIERMTGGGKKSAEHVYELKAPQKLPPIAKIPAGQLLIPEPDVLGALFNDDIVVRTAEGTRDPKFQAKWPDTLSRVLQSRIIQSFENANYLKTIGRTPEGLKVDYQLFVDVRGFQVITTPEPVADIELSIKIVSEAGKILGARVIHVTVPADMTSEATIAASLNDAFSKAAAELVVWACGAMAA